MIGLKKESISVAMVSALLASSSLGPPDGTSPKSAG